ncbi:MAG: TolC family outer membrane protein [Gammaproteobacteria bacterium]|nr:TolC family outer membrane protein [Gammaproteobacteria bacterium]
MNTRCMVQTILAVASLASGAVSAADLKDVYERALTNDPLIREADANRLATRESRPQAIAALLPQVRADGTWYDTIDSNSTGTFVAPGVPLTPDVRNFDGDREAWNLSLRQSVFSWESWAALRRADSERAQAEADYLVAQQDLVVRTAAAYFNVLAARDTLEAGQAAYDAIGRQLEQSEKRFEVGLIAVTDVQDAKAAFDSATAALIQAKRNLATSGEILRELTGDTWDVLERPGDDMPLKSPDPESPDDWVKLAMDQNARLISSQLAADITRANVNVERGGHVPSVDFVVNRGFNETTGTLKGTTAGETSDRGYDTVYGLQVTVPIFSGGQTSSRVRQAEYRNIAARERLERTARETERSTRDAYLGVNSEVARVKSLQQAVESAKTALEATEAGYEVGTRTSVDVLQARQRLFQSQTDFARSRYDYLLNVLRLQQAAGTLDRKGLEDINALLSENVTVR